MGHIKYVAVNVQGRKVKGKLEASSVPAAVEILRNQGLWPIRCYDASKSLLHREITIGGPKVQHRDFAVFCRQLAALYRSGIQIIDAVASLGEQSESKTLRTVMKRITDDIKHGASFSQAASFHPSVFPSVFIHMIRAGETSGKLDEMLTRMADVQEKEHQLREKMKSALIYPAIMGVMVVLTVIILMMFIIPSFVHTFTTMGLELPLATRIVIGASQFMVQYWHCWRRCFCSHFL